MAHAFTKRFCDTKAMLATPLFQRRIMLPERKDLAPAKAFHPFTYTLGIFGYIRFLKSAVFWNIGNFADRPRLLHKNKGVMGCLAMRTRLPISCYLHTPSKPYPTGSLKAEEVGGK